MVIFYLDTTSQGEVSCSEYLHRVPTRSFTCRSQFTYIASGTLTIVQLWARPFTQLHRNMQLQVFAAAAWASKCRSCFNNLHAFPTYARRTHHAIADKRDLKNNNFIFEMVHNCTFNSFSIHLRQLLIAAVVGERITLLLCGSLSFLLLQCDWAM